MMASQTQVSRTRLTPHAMPDAHEELSTSHSISLPMALLIAGLLLIAASFTPIGDWAAQSQWSAEDSARFDRVSNEYKRSAYQAPARRGRTPDEWEAEREQMRQQMEQLQSQLNWARDQPKLWSRSLLGVGALLSVAGFVAHSKRNS